MERILVVDDEPDIHVFLERVLSDAGYRAEFASDGWDALRRIGARRPDLILLDLMMPGLDGWGVLEELRKAELPPPVVILTARGDFDAFARGMRERVAAFVAKPFHFGDLLATCRKVLDNPAHEEPVETERRREGRQHVIVGVRVLSREGTPLGLGELLDLSPGGAQVRLPVQLDPGDHVRLALHVSLDDIQLQLEGEVKWCVGQAQAFYHGLALKGLSPTTEARLKELFHPTDE